MRVCLYSTHSFYIFTYLGVQCNIINSECDKPKEDNDSDSKMQHAALDSEPSELTDGESQGESTEDEKLETEDEEFGQDTGSECEDNVEKRYMQLVNTYTSHVNYILGTF